MPNPEFQHFKDGNVIYDVSDAVARSHIEDVLSLTTSDGIHGMRYFSGTLSYYDSNTSEWVEIETGSGGIVELTAEEFAHLTEEEKNANVIYIITDALDGGTGELTGIFTGTHAQWNALSDEDKALYSLVFFTDDYETTSSAFIGATSSENGVAGIVPQPLIADKDKFLKGDGTWAQAAADDNYVGTKSAWDSMSASEKEKYKTTDFLGEDSDFVLDDVPTQNSQNGIKSGGVFSALSNKANKGTLLTETLVAGDTTVTFENIPTTGNNLIFFYTSTGVNYTEVDTSVSGEITLTFEEQDSDIIVGCEVKEA